MLGGPSCCWVAVFVTRSREKVQYLGGRGTCHGKTVIYHAFKNTSDIQITRYIPILNLYTFIYYNDKITNCKDN